MFGLGWRVWGEGRKVARVEWIARVQLEESSAECEEQGGVGFPDCGFMFSATTLMRSVGCWGKEGREGKGRAKQA